MNGPEMSLKSGYISQTNLKKTIEKLASFPTRNTNTVECQEAVELAKSWLEQIPGLEVELFHYNLPAGPRVPEAITASNVIATLHGESPRSILIGAHIDTLNRNGNPFADIAPGANDDASGVAIVLECARLMAQCNWKYTVRFVIFTGEEQGLVGATALAQHASENNWPIIAMLNCDTVGSSQNAQGLEARDRVRLFSEESPNHLSRELARYYEWLNATRTEQEPVRFLASLPRKRQEDIEFRPELILRQDRLGRGGDHMPFNRQGFTAVRFVESAEDLVRQHTPDDLPKHIDFDYLQDVCKVVLHGLTAIADGEPDPKNVHIVREFGVDTTIEWEGDPEQCYLIYSRETTSAVWESSVKVQGLKHTLKKSSKDDRFYAVGSLGGIPVPAQ